MNPVTVRCFLVALLLALCPAWVSAAGPDLLEPEKAFRFEARMKDPKSIEIRYRVADGYYMYRDRFQFALKPANAELGKPQFPAGKIKNDPYFGNVETYRGDVVITLPVEPQAGADKLMLSATSQGCADAGVCYVPYEHKAELRLAGLGGELTGKSSAGSARSATADVLSGSPDGGKAEDSRVAELFSGGLLLLVVSFFGFGLLLSFTPCVLPMVPILSGIIVGQGNPTRMHSFLLACAYVLGMAVTYALAGVAAGLSGTMLSAALQNPWVLSGFALVFVVLAAAMLGVYELQLPNAIQSRISSAANRLPGGRFAGVFSMGILSALIVGPCVAAPLAGALLYISQTRDVVLGASALFAMALGMGVPLLIVGASAGALLPKAGPWMESVKRFFGVALLAVAIYIVSPVVDVQVQMFAWAALLILTGVYLRALDAVPVPPHAMRFVAKGVGVIALVVGIAFLVGALSGSRDVLRPLAGVRATEGERAAGTAFRKVASVAELDQAIAASSGRPVMLDFYADWCVSCKEMERYTFADAQVQRRLSEALLLQADVTANNSEHQALLKRFRLFGPPGIIFFDRQGREMTDLRVIGYQPAAQFAAVLDRALQ
jgi:thioredoxin:protein disulfide reductase